MKNYFLSNKSFFEFVEKFTGRLKKGEWCLLHKNETEVSLDDEIHNRILAYQKRQDCFSLMHDAMIIRYTPDSDPDLCAQEAGAIIEKSELTWNICALGGKKTEKRSAGILDWIPKSDLLAAAKELEILPVQKLRRYIFYCVVFLCCTLLTAAGFWCFHKPDAAGAPFITFFFDRAAAALFLGIDGLLSVFMVWLITFIVNYKQEHDSEAFTRITDALTSPANPGGCMKRVNKIAELVVALQKPLAVIAPRFSMLDGFTQEVLTAALFLESDRYIGTILWVLFEPVEEMFITAIINEKKEKTEFFTRGDYRFYTLVHGPLFRKIRSAA